MRHLRKFNESSSEDIKSDLEDILLDFSDRGIPVNIKHIHPTGRPDSKDRFSITLGDEDADIDMISILPSDSKDEFLRVFDYMESKGYEFSSINYDYRGEIMILKLAHIGLGIDAISNQLFNGIDETNFLKIWFVKIKNI